MLRELTKQYISRFNAKDLIGVAALLQDDFVLEDPVVKRVEGKERALNAIKHIFTSCNSLSFFAKNIYVDASITIIEFELQLDEKLLKGVDVIEWQDGKMKELRAYLDVTK